MKYLNKFNESIVEDIKDLTENYLVYLTDEDFIYDIRNAGWNEIQISIHKQQIYGATDFNTFEWQDVKDRIIPFLMILKKDYTINSINFSIFKRDDGTGEEYGEQMGDGWIRGRIENNLEDTTNDNIKNQIMNMLIICIDDPDKKVFIKKTTKEKKRFPFSMGREFIKKFI